MVAALPQLLGLWEVIWKAKDFGRSFKNPVLTLGNFERGTPGPPAHFPAGSPKAKEISGEALAYTFAPPRAAFEAGTGTVSPPAHSGKNPADRRGGNRRGHLCPLHPNSPL